ncbi:hypothetical protein RB601_006142 [Gaeumannomyces tritici]
MSATASVKDLVKAISTFLSSPTLPLPEDLGLVIEAYLEKHPRRDDPAADRLQEELLQLHQRFVHGHPARFAAFLSILSSLRPSLFTGPKALQWFEILNDDVLESVWQEKDLAGETLSVIESTLASKLDESEGLKLMLVRSLDRWIGFADVAAQSGEPSIIFKERMIRQTLVTWGKKQPKLLFETLNARFLKRESRARCISLLCEFVRMQPPHLHLVAQTPLLDNIITCLQHDTSTTVVSLALTALTMLLPHLPSALVPYLPTLFNIYARLLFWDRERSPETNLSSPGIPAGDGDQWETVRFSPESEDVEIPQLLEYFTLLYGLYPINFMDYIRKPQRYLRHANAPNPDDIEVQPSEIRHRSEKFRQMHLLHPNFYSLTIDSEKTDFGRWIKSEPAVVVAECMALCVANGPVPENAVSSTPLGGDTSPYGGDEADRSSSGGALLSSSVVLSPPQGPFNTSWRHGQSVTVESSAGSRANSTVMRQNSQSSHLSRKESLELRVRDTSVDSPTLHPLMVLSPSQTQLQEMIHSNKVMKSNIGQSLTNDSVPSLALSHQESISERPFSTTVPQAQSAIRLPLAVTENGGEVARLRRQIMVLNNDLNFERYMKQQHMAHIGELRRCHMKEAATEAETQSLIINNRNLRSQVENAKRAELQVRKDSERSRTLAKKWEADLSAKLKTLREEQKKRNAEMDSLKRELDYAREECEKLRALVCDFEVKEINAKQTMQSIDVDMAELGRLRGVVERLTASERDYQARQLETEIKLAEASAAEQRAEVLAMQVQSLQGELQATQDHYESHMMVLNTELASALNGGGRGGRGGGESDEVMATFESALAASRAKQAELQKQYGQLMRKYTVLQAQLLDRAQNTRAGRDGVTGSADADAEVSAIVGRSFGSQRAAWMQRGMSDPESLGTSQQGSIGSGASSASMAIRRPSTPPPAQGGVGSPSTTSGNSPQGERYYGRGGVQNLMRKDKKEKKKDEAEKKEKKSSGMRGIRGFV